jgi:hypothetical protein
MGMKGEWGRDMVGREGGEMGARRDAYSQIITVRSDHGREEANLLYTMTLPDAQGMVLEAGEKVGETAREGGVDAEFDDHVGGMEFEDVRICVSC